MMAFKVFDPTSIVLSSDLYEWSMAVAYVREGLLQPATFEVTVRELPPRRGFCVFSGLDLLLDLLSSFEVTDQVLEALMQVTGWPRDRLMPLSGLRFDGTVWAMPEGSVFFAGEPVVVVRACMPVAQVIETLVLNTLHVESLVATKAARIRLSWPNRTFVDFGSRRAQGLDAAVRAARASYVAGFDGTSNVLAARSFGIPCVGTMAHSYVLAHATERDAFLAFARTHPENTVFLVDTYDSEEGIQAAVEAARVLEREGIGFAGVRLDSGDLASLSRKARQALDEAGFKAAKVLASGNLDEYSIHELAQQDVPIDGFGVGTRLVVSQDAPCLEITYKCVEYAGRPVMKLSPDKLTLPGRKQVFRRFDRDGYMVCDVVGLWNEQVEGQPMMRKWMEGGRRLSSWETTDARDTCVEQVNGLPDWARSLHPDRQLIVKTSGGLRSLAEKIGRPRSTG